MAQGVVREWHVDEGWGVLDSNETPGGCWAHFSALDMDGFAAAVTGQLVDFTFVVVDQDGYAFRAATVHIDGVARRRPSEQKSDAYSSTLRVARDGEE
jgi:CspA family cold shock protein